MKKPYNYRNPTAAEIKRRERMNEVIEGWLGAVLVVLNLVAWAMVAR